MIYSTKLITLFVTSFDTDEESVDSYAISKYYESKYKEENNKSLKLTK